MTYHYGDIVRHLCLARNRPAHEHGSIRWTPEARTVDRKTFALCNPKDNFFQKFAYGNIEMVDKLIALRNAQQQTAPRGSASVLKVKAPVEQDLIVEVLTSEKDTDPLWVHIEDRPRKAFLIALWSCPPSKFHQDGHLKSTAEAAEGAAKRARTTSLASEVSGELEEAAKRMRKIIHRDSCRVYDACMSSVCHLLTATNLSATEQEEIKWRFDDLLNLVIARGHSHPVPPESSSEEDSPVKPSVASVCDA